MAKKRKAGQPTKYKDEYCEMLIEHFDVEPFVEREKTIVTKSGDVIKVPTDVANNFPTLAGFAIKLGVAKDTLHEWSRVHPKFSDAYKRAKDFQEHFLATNGLKGLVNTAFGIFTAKNVIGWRDKTETEMTVKEIKIDIDKDEQDV